MEKELLLGSELVRFSTRISHLWIYFYRE